MWMSSRFHLWKRPFSTRGAFVTTVKGQLIITDWIYFQALDSQPGIYLSALSPLPQGLHHCSFTGRLEVR